MRHFGGQYLRLELMRRFYRPMEGLLSAIADEFISTGMMSNETLLRAERFVDDVKRYGSTSDDDLIVEQLAAEYARRHWRDRLFRQRLEKFLERLLSGDEAPPDYDTYRLLDDIRSIKN